MHSFIRSFTSANAQAALVDYFNEIRYQQYSKLFPGVLDMFPQTKTAAASGKSGPAFDTPPADAVADAFARASGVGLTREQFAKLALLCLDEAIPASKAARFTTDVHSLKATLEDVLGIELAE